MNTNMHKSFQCTRALITMLSLIICFQAGNQSVSGQEQSVDEAWKKFSSKYAVYAPFYKKHADKMESVFFDRVSIDGKTESFQGFFVIFQAEGKSPHGVIAADFCKREELSGQYSFKGNVRFWKDNSFLVGGEKSSLVITVVEHVIMTTKAKGLNKISIVELPSIK